MDDGLVDGEELVVADERLQVPALLLLLAAIASRYSANTPATTRNAATWDSVTCSTNSNEKQHNVPYTVPSDSVIGTLTCVPTGSSHVPDI